MMVTRFRSHWVVLALGALGLTTALRPSPGHAADTRPPRIAVIDMQRAVMETEDGLRAQSTLRKYFERRQLELNFRQEELAKKKEDIEKQAKVLSKEALQRALEDWQRQLNELQIVFSEYERERVRKQNDVTAPIYSRVSGLLRKLAQREGYDLILDRQVVPYAKADLDITDQIILMYNNDEEVAATPPPSAAASSSAAPPSSAPPSAASR
ncbi:MAG: OmpH family outer membrane protein [Myxococcales bacterium]|nr:OmpH family outer membrane protein [Polyangiaceae bacterium]MDW8251560.1 OmpH family outer membrane protein [Myxococcales bacterium]